MEKKLTNQQYTYKLVEDGIKKVNELDREEFINPWRKNEKRYTNYVIGNYSQPYKQNHITFCATTEQNFKN